MFLSLPPHNKGKIQTNFFRDSKPKANVLDLFKTRNMLKKTLIQMYVWFTASFVYYGLSLNSDTLIPGKNIFKRFLLFKISSQVSFTKFLSNFTCKRDNLHSLKKMLFFVCRWFVRKFCDRRPGGVSRLHFDNSFASICRTKNSSIGDLHFWRTSFAVQPGSSNR
jgi:hypothetical protein